MALKVLGGRWSLMAGVALAVGLAGCGGSTPKRAATPTAAAVTAAPPSTVSTPTLTTFAPTTTAKPAPQTRAHAKGHRAPVLIGTPVRTTIAATSPTRRSLSAVPKGPRYTGPSPTACLKAAGLNRARQSSVSSHVWQANVGNSPLHDGAAIVFLSGPFESVAAARTFAQPMVGTDVVVVGGRWVASAAVGSNLDQKVVEVARCMATV